MHNILADKLLRHARQSIDAGCDTQIIFRDILGEHTYYILDAGPNGALAQQCDYIAGVIVNTSATIVCLLSLPNLDQQNATANAIA